MARLGEGDKRWIVEDRADGTNVHNWHWAETNCLEWSRNLFSQLLSDLTVLNDEGNLFIKIKNVDKVDGEAYVNVRKGKIIPGYELSLSLSWEGEAKDSDGKSLLKVDGTVQVPYISDENADEDPELKFTVNDEGPVGKRLKEAMIARGKPLILDKIRVWVESMAKGGPVKDDLEPKKVTQQNPSASTSAATPKKEAVVEKKVKSDNKKGFTQSDAKISKGVGGEFFIFNGSVTGTNVELQESKLIVQKWRFGNWPDGIHSMVRLVFEEPEPGVTIIKLTHSDIPDEDSYGNATVVENTERGWRDLIFQRIRAVFGFGL
ncbi:hypothetical protein QN277_021135 [Acacia crassicarpa]|uniref:Activator of Hsp90 ATPase AHSA1-like N-terminal domain-containing protein n=1 Tax=Acacia crassicarpa TaxID=499986 RepID=A0AAE1MP52_9FABA|nr:hypothetical protein QN277_021135 [Acacia crassicarpa]